MSIYKGLSLMLCVGLVVIALSGCEREGEGPAERAGKKIDETVKKAGETMEKAGEKKEEATKQKGY